MSAKLPASKRLRDERRDPLAPILALGRRQVRTGAMMSIAGTLIVHGAGAGQAASSMIDVAAFASSVRSEVRERLRAELDIDLTPPPPPPEPEPEPPAPEPEAPEPEAPPPKEAPAPQETAPPPAAAQAAAVMTSEPDPNAPLDLTADGFVVGTADSYAGGITASTGTSKTAVRDVRATPTGVGKAPATAVIAPTAAPAVDRSRAPKARGLWAENCPFPAEANAEGVNRAVVMLTVTITPDGRVQSASVAQDPGTGFGRQARSCALREGRFDPALDSAGNPIPKTISLRMRFNR